MTKKNAVIKTDRKQVVDAGGVRLYSIGAAADRIGRSVDFLRNLHYKKVLPDTGYRSEMGWRYYTEQQVVLLTQAFSRLSPRARAYKIEEALGPVLEKWNG